jgi:DNA polymerase
VLGLGNALGCDKFHATVFAEEGIWLDDEFCQMVVSVYRKQQCPEVPVLWKAIGEAAIHAVQDGGEWQAGGDDFGNGMISYFMNDTKPFLHCRLPSGRLLAYLYPEVHTKVMWKFNALNEHDKPTVVRFPSKLGVPIDRARYHAERIAEKQHKRLLPEAPESFLAPHLSFMGRNIITRQWQRCGTHGGSLTENADQASSRDLLAEAMARVDATGVFRLLLSIHDEVIAEAPIGTATVEEFENLMSEVPIWATGMPIRAEGWIGPRLRK